MREYEVTKACYVPVAHGFKRKRPGQIVRLSAEDAAELGSLVVPVTVRKPNTRAAAVQATVRKPNTPAKPETVRKPNTPDSDDSSADEAATWSAFAQDDSQDSTTGEVDDDAGESGAVV